MNSFRRAARICEASYALLLAVLWSALPFPPTPEIRFASAALAAAALCAALVAWRLGDPDAAAWRGARIFAALCLACHLASIRAPAFSLDGGRALVVLAAALQGVFLVLAIVIRYRTGGERPPVQPST
jgi:mono/diheme cytochrome c family protein